jgi:hypothetical protein
MRDGRTGPVYVLNRGIYVIGEATISLISGVRLLVATQEAKEALDPSDYS